MARATRRPPKTVDDYMALPDDVRAELIRGELYVTPAPRRPHQEAIENLHVLMSQAVRRLGLGRVHLSPMDVHLPTRDVVQPDLFFVAKANYAIRQDWIRGVPDLVVEVVSPTHPERDRIVKRDLYAECGVASYWIVDPDAKAIEMLRLEGGRYEPEAYFTGSAVATTAALPGVEIPLDEVFRADE